MRLSFFAQIGPIGCTPISRHPGLALREMALGSANWKRPSEGQLCESLGGKKQLQQGFQGFHIVTLQSTLEGHEHCSDPLDVDISQTLPTQARTRTSGSQRMAQPQHKVIRSTMAIVAFCYCRQTGGFQTLTRTRIKRLQRSSHLGLLYATQGRSTISVQGHLNVVEATPPQKSRSTLADRSHDDTVAPS